MLQGDDGRHLRRRPAASATRSPAPSASTTGRCRRRRRCRRRWPAALLAVADKADNIVGAWVAGEKPSGSRDPYGLRRAAMGIVRIALEYSLRFPLRRAARGGASTSSSCRAIAGLDDARRAAIVAETAAFVRERLQVLLLDEGLPFPMRRGGAGRAGRRRAGAGRAGARASPRSPAGDVFEDAVTAYNRCAALAAKDAGAGSRAVDPALFSDAAERELRGGHAPRRAGRCSRRWRDLELESAVAAAAGLRPAVDRYFDDVLVMDSDAGRARQPAGAAGRRRRRSSAASATSAACRCRRPDAARRPTQTHARRDRPESPGGDCMASKYVYDFSEGNKDMKELLGGKGANLAEMTSIGLPVPPGFTITTEVCNHYSANGSYPDGARRPGRGGARRTSRQTPARSSATPPTRCSSRCAPAPAPRCRA